MRRRELLGAAGLALGSLAGCAGLIETRSARVPPLVSDRPDAAYVPTHVEGMGMAGMKSDAGYNCALTYTFPHRFWLVTGRRVEKVEVREADSVHLMPVVWETETGIVPPDLNPSVAISKDGEAVVPSVSPWPMLSQPMGFHFGDNVALDGDGTYTVDVSIGTPSTRRTGSLAGNEGEASFTFEFEFSRSELSDLSYRDVPAEREGTRGAVEPMSMEMLPSTQVPAEDALPGTVHGSAASGDARFVVTTLSASRFGADGSYLAVSPRTPHNRYVLPLMSLSGTLTRGDETVADDSLQATIDPELGYHYGMAVPGVESGDELAVTVDAPPQTARHEGYETAFVEMDAVTFTL